MDDSCVETMACTWSGAEPFDRAVNFEYLLDVIAVMEGKRVTIRMTKDVGEGTAIRKTLYRIDEGGFSAVILPVRPPRQKTEEEKNAAETQKKGKGRKSGGEEKKKEPGPMPQAVVPPPPPSSDSTPLPL